jgi:hypothetical protein
MEKIPRDRDAYYESEDNPYLVLHYSNSSLSIAVVKSEGLPPFVRDFFHLGADSELMSLDSQLYWAGVKVKIKPLVREQKLNIGEIILLGSRAQDQKLLQVVRSIFEKFPHAQVDGSYPSPRCPKYSPEQEKISLRRHKI